MRPGVRARSSEGCSVVRRPSGTETGVAAHRHARRMPAGAIPVEAEGPGLVERGPEGHAVAQRAEHGAREGQVVRDDALAQPAAVAVLQHLRRPAPPHACLAPAWVQTPAALLPLRPSEPPMHQGVLARGQPSSGRACK